MRRLGLAVVGIAVLALVSLLIGAYSLSWASVFGGGGGNDQMVVFASRVPRTIALILAGMSLAIVGLIMQMLARNRFVEPSTAGTVESATLGVLVVTMIAPASSILTKMIVASVFALAGTALFLLILSRIPLRPPWSCR